MSVLLVCAACSGKDGASDTTGTTGGTTSLGEAILLPFDTWSYVPPDSDPFDVHDAGAEPCPSVAFGAENGFFEIETDYCAITTFTQPLAEEVKQGSTLRFVVWNLDLWAPEPYDAVRVLRLGDTDLWTHTTPVPGDESVTELEIEAPEDLPAGTDCFFHLRNHGINSWRIGDVERL